MTPAARLAAAIALVQRLETGGEAADRALTDWGRSNRFAGAKDRRAIADLVYAVYRDRGALSWRLGEAASPRLLTIAAAGEGADALCTGERFAPAPLDDAERAALGATPAEPMPDWARLNYPAFVDAGLRRRFGAELDAAMTAMAARAPVDLRVNTLKGGRDDAAARLADAGIAATLTPYSPLGLRLSGRDRLDDHALIRDGFVEPQDESAQLCALLVDARPGQQVVDFCAGAGGKTLALAASMTNKGQIFACDVDRRRLDRLKGRLTRAGVRNVQTHPLTGDDDPWFADQGAFADRVLVDAPCSGSGTWRRNPEARHRLTPDSLARHLARQDAILDRAARLVRPGGRLVYATCSLLPEEDEDRIDAFLARHADFHLLALPDGLPVGGDYLILSPHAHGTDGFFVAVLGRQSG